MKLNLSGQDLPDHVELYKLISENDPSELIITRRQLKKLLIQTNKTMSEIYERKHGKGWIEILVKNQSKIDIGEAVRRRELVFKRKKGEYWLYYNLKMIKLTVTEVKTGENLKKYLKQLI